MILVDTSVWIDHFNNNDSSLVELLGEGSVLMHQFVRGELGCGSLKNRASVLEYLDELPKVMPASHKETAALTESRKLWGLGIGWVDAHLLASALLSHCELWTNDKRLHRAALAARVRLYRMVQ